MHSSCLINQLNTVNTKYILKIFQGQSLMPGFRKHADISKKIYPVDTGRKLNVHKTFGRRPGRLLNVLCTSSLRPVFTGKLLVFKRLWELTFAQHFQMITTLQFQKWSKGFLLEKKQNSQTSSFIFITIIDSLYYSITGNYIFLTLRPNIGKYGPEITPYLDTFQAVTFFRSLDSWLV